jgi:regulator of sigma E protease
MTTILIFLGVLGFLVIVHELGHLTVAKLRGVQVLEFGLGYPPRLFGFRYRDTDYTLNLLPLGGFVRMLGEDNAEDPDDPRAFVNKGPFTRLAILAAGATMNAILPVFLLTIALLIPQDIVVTDVVVTKVAPNAPAEQAGIQPGDVIREVDGRKIDNSTVLQQAIQVRLGAESTWLVERDTAQRQVRLVPQIETPWGAGATGIQIANARVSVQSVAFGSLAGSNGLRPGDELVLIEPIDGGVGHQVIEASDVAVALEASLLDSRGQGVQVLVLRDGALVTLALPDDPRALSGATLVERPIESRSEPIWRAFPLAFLRMGDILISFRNELSRILAGAGDFTIAGPVGIAQITGEVANAGISPLITWTALLSINLAIVNLLPIPALDGGRIVFVLLELARGGRRLAPEKEQLVHLVGFGVLIGAILLVSVQDIRRIIGGGNPLGG